MKKLPIFFLVLTLSLSGWALPAGGASASAPKAICLNWVTPQDLVVAVMSLAIKMSGTIKLQPGPVKFYAIQGELLGDAIEYVPIYGSGHMNGSNFHFSLSGSNWNASLQIPAFQSFHMEGIWNIVSQSGTIWYEARSGNNAPISG